MLSHRPERPAAFTLIELLIVVAIIGTLAAIALPNFLNAKIRANVARAKADFNSLGTALQSYYLDHQSFPRDQIDSPFYKYQVNPCAYPLTTPVAYISSLDIRDPFINEVERQKLEPDFEGSYTGSYTYYNYNEKNRFGSLYLQNCSLGRRQSFVIMTYGPNYLGDGLFALPGIIACPDAPVGNTWVAVAYKASNGLRSAGDIAYFGGQIPVGGLVGG